jgi:hypothetical protein
MILGIDIARGLGRAVVLLALAAATTTMAQEVNGIDDFGTARNSLRTFQADRQVLSGKFKAEVEQALRLARKSMRKDPSGVVQRLKFLLDSVQNAPELGPELRGRLTGQVEAALRRAQRQARDKDAREVMRAQGDAIRNERTRIQAALEQNQQKMTQLMDRFASLVVEGEYRYAADVLGPEIAAINAPGARGLSRVAIHTAGTTGSLRDQYAARDARHLGFRDAIYQVDKSAVPFPDEPPIVYPDAEIWEDLTLRRKQYAAVDLAKQGSKEQRINRELQEDTELEFIETPLGEAIDFLKDLHEIEIQIDTGALEDVGIDIDTPITRNLKGISLRSALRLILRDLDLTYMIRDEVLQITTPEVADTHLAVKVYPVGDLVLPIMDARTLGGGALGGFGMGNGAGMNGGNGAGFGDGDGLGNGGFGNGNDGDGVF